MDKGAWWAAVHGVAKSRTQLSNFTFTFHFHASEKEMATHSSVLAWRIPGMGEPGGLPSMGSHRVGHDWSDLAAAAGKTNRVSCWRFEVSKMGGELSASSGFWERGFKYVPDLDQECEGQRSGSPWIETLKPQLCQQLFVWLWTCEFTSLHVDSLSWSCNTYVGALLWMTQI